MPGICQWYMRKCALIFPRNLTVTLLLKQGSCLLYHCFTDILAISWKGLLHCPSQGLMGEELVVVEEGAHLGIIKHLEDECRRHVHF